MVGRIAGIVLIVLGVIGLATGGLPWMTERHHIEMGPVAMDVKEKKTLPVPPVVGIVALVAGIALVLARRPDREEDPWD